jgi:hypothetical protein
MQTVTIELMDNKVLKLLQNLEDLNLIRMVKKPDYNSLTFQGEPLSIEDFKLWVEYIEKRPTLSMSEAKQRWEIQRAIIQKLIL